MSDSEAAGKLTIRPGIVDAAATRPIRSLGIPRLVAKGFKTGFLDIVELRMAKKPMILIIRKKLCVVFVLRNILFKSK